MSKFSERYDDWSSSQQNQTDSYAYEASYDKFMREMSKELLQESVGHERDSRKKKPINTKFGQLEIPKQHVLCRTPLGFKMTPYWQEKCIYMGQQEIFEQGSETLEKLTGQYVPAKQVERMCHAYGQLLDTHESEANKKGPVFQSGDVVYGMMDGSMILTREDGWKEMKLARVFSDKALLPENKERNFIREPTYVAHLGGKHPFLDKVEKVIGSRDKMVWIADGAKWIWNWVDDYYPGHHQILDFFHASEKLHAFAREAFKKENEKKQWGRTST